MMQTALPTSWRQEFARAAAMKREEVVSKDKAARFEAQERERRNEDRTDRQRDEIESAAFAELALAPPAQLAAFELQLDTYDATTVEVLMDNQDALEALQRNMDGMLAEAHVLPDGRRVFKSRDGQRVVDESGQELAAEIVDPESVDDKKPRWETFRDARDEGARLTEERRQLLDYQRKLDDARDRLDDGDITVKGLKDIKADLAKDMPDAVREKLGIEKANSPKGNAPAEPTTSAPLPANMDNLMRQTGFTPG